MRLAASSAADMRSRLARPGQGLLADSLSTLVVNPSDEYADVLVAGVWCRGGLSSQLLEDEKKM